MEQGYTGRELGVTIGTTSVQKVPISAPVQEPTVSELRKADKTMPVPKPRHWMPSWITGQKKNAQ